MTSETPEGRPWRMVAILLTATALCIGLAYGLTWLVGNDRATEICVMANPLIGIIALALCSRYRPRGR